MLLTAWSFERERTRVGLADPALPQMRSSRNGSFVECWLAPSPTAQRLEGATKNIALLCLNLEAIVSQKNKKETNLDS